MLFINKKDAGKSSKVGINYYFNQKTKIFLSFVLPIPWFRFGIYDRDHTKDYFRGLRIRVIMFGFRLRRKSEFSAGVKLFSSRFGSWLVKVGKQKLISTYEEKEDGLKPYYTLGDILPYYIVQRGKIVCSNCGEVNAK